MQLGGGSGAAGAAAVTVAPERRVRVAKPKLPVRTCAGCGDRFEDPSRTAPRTYCLTCSPPKGRRSAAAAPPRPRRLRAAPFTVAHFRTWANRLSLPGEKRFRLERWEELFVEDVFAGIRDGGIREAWLIVPEGNGKSTLISILILYCVEFAEEAQIPVAAAARDQAEIIFTQGSGFVRRSDSLRGRFQCKPGLREVVAGASRAKIFASDAGTGDGIIPYPIEVIDELHRHLSLELYRTWAGKLDKQLAVLIVISTAGAPGSEFEQVREHMRQEAAEVQRDGCFARYSGATYVLHEYAVPEDGDVMDLKLVKAANPSARITVKTLAAKRSRPSFSLPHWRRLTCNVPTRHDSAAVTEAEWAGAAVADGEREIPAGERVKVGLDLGWVHDTTALVPLWLRDPRFRLLGPATILEPPGDGSQLDAHLVERALIDTHARTPIDMVVMDMTKGEQLAQWIEEELGATVVNRSQGNQLAAVDYERFMEGLRVGWLRHCGDDGLRRHVLNAVARLLPSGQTRFDRPRVSRTVAPELQRARVIDALVAAAMVNTTVAADLHVDAGVVYA